MLTVPSTPRRVLLARAARPRASETQGVKPAEYRRRAVSLRPIRDVLFVAVPLHGRGVIRAYTLVDLADEPLMRGRRWHLMNTGYARANRSGGGMDYLHRLLFGLADGDEREVDHINLDKLDNRRGNLRLATRAEN